MAKLEKHHKVTLRNFIRVISVLCVILSILLSYFAITNFRAQNAYNVATRSLIANIKASKKLDVDKDMLRIQQQQTDAEFYDASSKGYAILLPELSESIRLNAEISKKFTKELQKKVEDEKRSNSKKIVNGEDTSEKSTKDNNDKSKSSQSNHPQASEKSNPELSKNQRNQVENLLKNNNHTEHSDDDSSDDADSNNQKGKTIGTARDSSNSTKPW